MVPKAFHLTLFIYTLFPSCSGIYPFDLICKDEVWENVFDAVVDVDLASGVAGCCGRLPGCTFELSFRRLLGLD